MVASTIPSPPPDIAGSAARVGAYVWLSSRLFEVTGAWSRNDDDAPAREFFVAVSSRFAWQSREWFERLPFLAEVQRDQLVRAPGRESIRRMEMLESLKLTDERAIALAGVVTDLDAIYLAHEQSAQPVRDAPLQRSLRRVRVDIDELRRGDQRAVAWHQAQDGHRTEHGPRASAATLLR